MSNGSVSEFQAVVKASPAIVPGVATILADWLGVINTFLSIVFLAASIAFLLWRWNKARKEPK